MAVRYICTRKCFHNGRLYRIGNTAIFKSAKDGPQDKKGKLINFEPYEVSDGPPVVKSRAEVSVKVNNEEV